MRCFAFALALLVLVFVLVAPTFAAAAPPIVLPALTPETLGTILSGILALIAMYVPAYNDLDRRGKAVTMFVLLFLISIGLFAGSCGGIVSAGLTCDKEGAISFLSILFACIVANQGTFMLAVRPFQRE